MHIQILSSFSSQQFDVGIYTEHLVWNLLKIKNLSISQCLYLLRKTLFGFEAIYNKLGYVVIDPQSCGITNQGQCRIWINDNFSMNRSQKQNQLKKESNIIIQILKLIKSCTNNQCINFFNSLQKSLEQVKKSIFKFIQDFIISYSQKYQIAIPTKLKYQFQDTYQNKKKDYQKINKTNYIDPKKSNKSYSNLSFHKNHQESENIPPIGFIKMQHRVSLADRLPLFPTIQINNKSKLLNSSKGNLPIWIKSDESTTLRSNSSLSEQQTPPKSTQRISPIKTPQNRKLKKQKIQKELSSLGYLLGAINEGDQEEIQRDHIIEKSYEEVTSQKSNKKNKRSSFKNICHQFSINIITQKINNIQLKLKDSIATTNRTKHYSQNQNPNQDNSLKKSQHLSQYQKQDKNHHAKKVSRFCSQGDQQLRLQCAIDTYFQQKISQTQINEFNDFKEEDCYSQKAHENRNSLWSKLKEEKIRSTTKRKSRLLGNILQSEEQYLIKNQFKKKQQQIISANCWKKVVKRLLTSDKDIDLKHSTSYEFQDGRRYPSPAKIKLDKLDAVGRCVDSIIN